ncbi:Gfo/Idh/MocA family protein [Gracilibacillus alcaliphilus]|uniref:Gfo/Idh/MocA family protein n=1 Tax=Gracilibacillus alcaliphilus TaxID=1401441 RepID=UPI00195CED00|nr:Gfo/Idh/MocA family oxidoreductase [Gracilibacillus alcaliphilus]MBM7675567.1 putative dehydrogenase [Gracilibacillus alcaliphilus]
MNNQIVKIGLIGLGGMSNFYRHIIAGMESIQITAICDVNPELLAQAGEQENIREECRFRDMEQLIAYPEIDAVIAVVPNHLHAKVLELCIAHQKAVISEKPFTLNVMEAEKLKTLYENSPIPCAIGFIHRYTPSFQYAKDMVEANVLGHIEHIDVRYEQSFGSPVFNTPFLWRYDKEISGTGALGDLGAHMIDSARFFVGEFQSVSAMMKTLVHKRVDPDTGEEKQVTVDDFTSFQAILAEDVIGTFVTTRNAVGSNNKHTVTIYGEYGTIHVDIERPKEIDICSADGAEKKPAFQTEKVPDKYKKTLVSDFVELLSHGSVQHMPTFYDGYINQKVIDAIIQSAGSNTNVNVE